MQKDCSAPGGGEISDKKDCTSESDVVYPSSVVLKKPETIQNKTSDGVDYVTSK